LDDNPTGHDRAWLRVHDRQDRLIEVSSDQDPNALLAARCCLRNGHLGYAKGP
jgi:hypothetical protein